MKKSAIRALATLLALLIWLPSFALAEGAAVEAELARDAAPATEDVVFDGEVLFEQPDGAEEAGLLPAADVAVDAFPDETPADAVVIPEEEPEEITEEAPEEDALPEAIFGEDALSNEAGPLDTEDVPCEGAGVSDVALDNDALFDAYVSGLLGLDGAAAPNRHVGYTLAGPNYQLYCLLLDVISQIASGSRTSTEITFAPEDVDAPDVLSRADLGLSDARQAGAREMMAAMGLNLDEVFEYLLWSDCAYEMYWYGRDYTYTVWADKNQDAVTVSTITLRMTVNKSYAAGSCQVSAERLAAVRAALSNARSIVNAYAGIPDHERIAGYVRELCALTDYNHEAADSGSIRSYGVDPWAIVWMFDGNPATKVVCEGYARSFKYLCDMTAWQGDIYCYTITGDSHMWNIVTMPDGRNYHVDVTWTDNSDMKNWYVLLPAVSQDPGQSYTVRCESGARGEYTLYTQTWAMYGTALLTLAESAYDPESGAGNLAVQSVSIRSFGALSMLPGEKRTLSAVYTPANAHDQWITWLTSNPAVATLSVNPDGSCVVTAVDGGSAVITVRTYNERTDAVTIQVGEPVTPTAVCLDRTGTVNLTCAETLQLNAAFEPANGYSALTWTTSDPAVATVSDGGLVTAVGGGSAVITARTANGKTASVTVSVYDPYVPDQLRVWLGDQEVADGSGWTTLKGRKLAFTASAYLNGALQGARGVSWSSSEPGVATIDAYGTLTAVGTGTATVTASVYGGTALSFQVRVLKNKGVYVSKVTKKNIRSVDKWAVWLKSVEVVSPTKVVAVYILINRLGSKSRYIANFNSYLTVGGVPLAGRNVKKVSVACKKNKARTFKVTYTGSQVYNTDFDLVSGSVPDCQWGGTLYYR